MMVELVDPDIGQKICDPACGTGGFLIAAYQHILRKYTTPDMVRMDRDGTPHNLVGNRIKKKDWNRLSRETLYGFDFEITLIRIALMNLILHGIREPKIAQINTLSKRFVQKPMYRVVLANPPFAGYINKAEISHAFKLETTKTELLFVELFYNILAVGGKAGIIVPNGVLFGTSNAHIRARRLILEKCDLQAVISMPSGVFLPYSGVGTGVLLFVKGGKTKNVWFYDMRNDGYTLDQKRDFKDGQGDIPDIIHKFRSGRLESDHSILVPFRTIKANYYSLSISNYRTTLREEVKYEEPDLLIANVARLEQEIAQQLAELSRMI
jgi:type I restriction enzyme M protein